MHTLRMILVDCCKRKPEFITHSFFFLLQNVNGKDILGTLDEITSQKVGKDRLNVSYLSYNVARVRVVTVLSRGLFSLVNRLLCS